jgi:hypothetical protein
MSVATRLLDRLQHVKKTAPNRWLARCPAHEDRSPSLSIRELDDGRVLLHDFGCCSTTDVLAAIGLEMGDLFEKPLGQFLPQSHSGIPARDILAVVDGELLTAIAILDDIVARRAATPAEIERLTVAAGRIGRAKDWAHGR